MPGMKETSASKISFFPIQMATEHRQGARSNWFILKHPFQLTSSRPWIIPGQANRRGWGHGSLEKKGGPVAVKRMKYAGGRG